MIDLLGDMERVFIDFGVTREYRPRGGDPDTYRNITVIENVRPYAPVDPMPGSLAPVAEVLVRNDESIGIARGCLDTGGDQIEVMLRGELQLRPIVRVLEEDETVIKLEVR